MLRNNLKNAENIDVD